MRIFANYSLLLFVALGCSYQPDAEITVVVPDSIETISSYDYEYYSGFNAAVSQFGKGNDDLFVDISNKRVLEYTSETDRQGYADGYHKALDILDSRINPKCPDLH